MARIAKRGTARALAEDGNYRLSDEQARAILDLRLQRLTGLERSKISEELEGLVKEIGGSLAKAWVKMHPLGRIGEPSEVAEAAVYLASDAAGFTTGTDLRVDGGLTVAPRYVPDLL